VWAAAKPARSTYKSLAGALVVLESIIGGFDTTRNLRAIEPAMELPTLSKPMGE